jgi:ATP-dependent Clp protease ATP-binding subunit ClpC
MFERFTDRSRRVLVLAQEESRLLERDFIGTEHLLLGLIEEDDGIAARVLRSFGIDGDAARSRIAELGGPSGASRTSSPPFDQRAKKVLELSLRESLELGHDYIGTEHLLLAIVREGEGVAAYVLVTLGAELTEVRHRVIDALSNDQSRRPRARPAQEATSAPPYCGRCGAGLADTVRYRLIDAEPVLTDAGSIPLTITVVYCSRCGTALGSLPGGLGAPRPPDPGDS